jgi:hypothetical protein
VAINRRAFIRLSIVEPAKLKKLDAGSLRRNGGAEVFRRVLQLMAWRRHCDVLIDGESRPLGRHFITGMSYET